MSAKPTPKTISKKDYITNKVLVVFSLSLIAVLALMFIYNQYRMASTFSAAHATMRGVMFAGIAVAVLGIVMLIIEKKRMRDVAYRIMKGKNILLVGALLSVFALFVVNIDYYISIKVLYVLIPAIAIYYLIFHCYQREFFAISLLCGGGIAGTFMLYRSMNGRYSAYTIHGLVAALFCFLALTVFFIVLRGKHGKLGRFQPMPADASYTLIFTTSGILVALLVLGVLIPAVMYYFIFATIAYLVAMAIYYTVKLL